MVDLLTVGASVLELTPTKNRRLETADRFEVAVAGPESNAAVAASRLGADCAWVSKLPETPLGRRVAGELGRHGVETAVCWSQTGRQGLAFSERASEPRRATTIHDRDGAVASMTPAQLPLSGVREASMVYTTGATAALSETLAETTATVFEELGEAGTTTVLGLSRPRAIESAVAHEASPLVSAADVLLTTEAGAAALAERTNPTELAHALASTHDFETVVLARENRGALVWHDKTVHDHAPPETQTVDDRGAFDALCGGFLARRLAGADPDRALAAGVACASLARTIAGPVPVVTPDELEACVVSMDAAGVE